MHHFFLPLTAMQGDNVLFPIATAQQIQRVLRLREGDMVMVLDNQGSQYLVELIFGDSLSGVIKSRSHALGEPDRKIWLYLSLSHRDKMEWVLQKATELGCTGVVPMITRRSLVQDRGGVAKKYDRWMAILREAAEQCHRGAIPFLESAEDFQTAMGDAKQRCDMVSIPWVGEQAVIFREILQQNQPHSLAIMIGPEGGFTKDEVNAAIAAGIVPVSLGPRILRMETAAIAAVTMAMTELGEMDMVYSSSGGGPAGP